MPNQTVLIDGRRYAYLGLVDHTCRDGRLTKLHTWSLACGHQGCLQTKAFKVPALNASGSLTDPMDPQRQYADWFKRAWFCRPTHQPEEVQEAKRQRKKEAKAAARKRYRERRRVKAILAGKTVTGGGRVCRLTDAQVSGMRAMARGLLLVAGSMTEVYQEVGEAFGASPGVVREILAGRRRVAPGSTPDLIKWRR